MTTRKTENILEEEWSAERLEELKEIANSLADSFYPDIVAHLVETNDIAGSYLNSPMPYSPAAAMPFLKWCMHKYPPYSLDLDESLVKKRYRAKSGYLQQEAILELPCTGNIVDQVIDASIEQLCPYAEELKTNDSPVFKAAVANEIEGIFEEFSLTDLDYHSNHDYAPWREAREQKVYSDIEKFESNPLINYLLHDENFKEAFDIFWKIVEVDPSFGSDLPKKVIRFRFLLHVVILFLGVAGERKQADYTLGSIKEYNERMNRSKFQDFRRVLNDLRVNSTLPDARELKSIRSNAAKLLKSLNGRTKNYDLMIHLSALSKAKSTDFNISGRLPDKRNRLERVLIKSLASFFCSYSYETMVASSIHMNDEEMDKELKYKFSSINRIAYLLADFFMEDISEAYVSSNTEDVFDEFEELIDKASKLNDIQISNDFVDSQLLNSVLQKAQKDGLSVDPELVQIIRQQLENVTNLDDRKAVCKDVLQHASFATFWEHTFDCVGTISHMTGGLELKQVIVPTFSDEELKRVVEMVQIAWAGKRKELESAML